MTPVLFVGGFGLLLGVLIWAVSTMKTTPEGYTRIGSFDYVELAGVQRVLEQAGIPTITDDHSYRGRGGGKRELVHVLVPTPRAPEALELLNKNRDAWTYITPPA